MSTLLETHTLGQVSFLKCCNVTLRNIQRTLNITTNYNYSQLSLRPLTSKSDQLFFLMLKNKQYPVEIPPKRFHLNGHTMGFCPQIQNLELHTKHIVPLALTEVSFKWSHHRISSTSSKVRNTLPNPSCSLTVKVLPWA